MREMGCNKFSITPLLKPIHLNKIPDILHYFEYRKYYQISNYHQTVFSENFNLNHINFVDI